MDTGKTLAMNLLILVFILTLTPLAYGDLPFQNSQFHEVSDIIFHYRQWIPEEPIGSVLLVHGLGGSTFSFRYLVEPLMEEGYHVLAVDLPAFGYSDRKRGLIHSQKNRGEWLWSLLDSLEFKGSWHLVGHSMGGGTITAMALMKPDQVSSLTYLAGAIDAPSPSWARALRYPPFPQLLSLLARFFLQEKMIKRVLTSAYGTTPGSDAINGYLQPLLLKGTASSWVDLVGSSSKIQAYELEDLEMPALLIWGEEDTWVPLALGERLKGSLPQAKLHVLAKCGHIPQETHPKEVIAFLLDFFGHLQK